MITAVGGNGGYSGGKQFVPAEELRKRLSHLRHEKALIVKLVRSQLAFQMLDALLFSDKKICNFSLIFLLFC